MSSGFDKYVITLFDFFIMALLCELLLREPGK